MRERPRDDRSRRLPQPIIIPEVMALRTLADVQALMRHLPDERPGVTLPRCSKRLPSKATQRTSQSR